MSTDDVTTDKVTDIWADVAIETPYKIHDAKGIPKNRTDRKMNKGDSFWRNCGAASVGELFTKT